jgi:glycosyltransferase involved in cell wall biosynthesis
MELKIAGGGPLEDDVRQAAAVTPGITYLGQVPLAETYELMGRASVLIFPSKWYETFGRTVAEAFAKGTPVIAAKIGSMATMVTHGQTGLHFNPDKPETLVEQIDWMLAHGDDWRQMRVAARKMYEENYTPERNYNIMMDIYERATAQKQRRA